MGGSVALRDNGFLQVENLHAGDQTRVDLVRPQGLVYDISKKI